MKTVVIFLGLILTLNAFAGFGAPKRTGLAGLPVQPVISSAALSTPFPMKDVKIGPVDQTKCGDGNHVCTVCQAYCPNVNNVCCQERSYCCNEKGDFIKWCAGKTIQ